MLEKIYCHTKPKRWDIKSTYCEVGKWYYCYRYPAGIPDENRNGELNNTFDIKIENERFSTTKLCLPISDMYLFFYTRDEYRDKIITNILN